MTRTIMMLRTIAMLRPMTVMLRTIMMPRPSIAMPRNAIDKMPRQTKETPRLQVAAVPGSAMEYDTTAVFSSSEEEDNMLLGTSEPIAFGCMKARSLRNCQALYKAISDINPFNASHGITNAFWKKV